MRSPALAELPPPPAGRTGWPWTVETPQLPALRPDGTPWPRISIVTPSYNQGQFIEETIRSVLLQGYPDLEYIVIDGGSTDGAADIICKYAPWLTYWTSEPDRGQAHAIDKALGRSTGDIFQWINSDDVLLRDALASVGMAWNPGQTVLGPIFIGSDMANSELDRNARLSAAALVTGQARYLQPGVWMPRDGVREVGIDITLHYAFDWEMMIRFLLRPHSFSVSEEPLLFFRLHQGSKTISNTAAFGREGLRIRRALLHLGLDPAFEAVCRKALRRIIWHRHVDRIGVRGNLNEIGRMYQLLLLIGRRPLERLDRYALGRVRRLLWMRARAVGRA